MQVGHHSISCTFDGNQGRLVLLVIPFISLLLRFLSREHWYNDDLSGASEPLRLGELKDKKGLTAADVLKKARITIPEDVKQLLGIGDMEAVEVKPSKTLLINDPSFFRHNTCRPITRRTVSYPPENVTRLKVIRPASCHKSLYNAYG